MSILLDKIRAWWRRLPQKTRVQLIALVLFVFAGTEVFVLAPYILDIALMIDVGGLVVVLAALRSSVSVWMMQLHALAAMLAKPLLLVLRVGELVGDFGSQFPPQGWYRYYLFVDRLSTRGCAALLVLSVGLVLTKAFIGKP